MTSAAKSIGTYAKELVESLKFTVSGTGKSVKGLIVFIVTTLLNQLGNEQFFKCPTKKYELAGWSFMLIPGVMLGMLILMASERVSEGSTLCGRHNVSRRRKRSRVLFFLRAIALALGYSTLAFLSWLVASLLFTETYACAKLGPMPNTKNATILDIYKTKKDVENAESKIIGLFLLLGALFILMCFFFFDKCRLTSLSKITARLKGEESYDECEAKAAKEAFDNLVEVCGKHNGIMFVEKLIPAKYVKKEPPPKNKPESDEGSKAELDPETQKEAETVTLPKEQLMELRKKLIAKYPRLDNPLDWDLEYMDKAFTMREDRDDNPEGTSESLPLVSKEGENSGDC